MSFWVLLHARNEALSWFGAICLGLALVFLLLSQVTSIQVMGVNAWYKPLKFALSIGLYAWTLAWFTGYLSRDLGLRLFDAVVILTLGFELVYIGLQAGRGQLSHFQVHSPLYATLYMLMAGAATVAALATAYIGWRFFSDPLPSLPPAYLWGIRLGLILFVLFALEGFVMGSRMRHTIGGPDGGPGLPFLNWSTRYGDPRVAHFIGMHALQVLPLLGYYVLKNTKLILAAGVLYALLALWVLIQALQGRPLLPGA